MALLLMIVSAYSALFSLALVSCAVIECVVCVGNHMLAEARQCMLLQRVDQKADQFPARRALELATIGGAKVLGRDDIGVIEVGMAADFVAFKIDGIHHVTAHHTTQGMV